jgi:hypothetical protein
MAFTYVPGVNTYTTNTTGTGKPGGSGNTGNTGNNSGSSGTVGNQFLTDLVENLNTAPGGYTGSRSQANPGNNVLTPAEELKNIVNQRSTLANQAGIPKYLTNKFKHLFPQGNVPYADMTGQQRAIADFYAGSTPNAYQQAIQNFMDASPENMEAYKSSGLKGAGLNAFMTTVPEALAERSMLGQGLKAFTGLADNVFDKLGTAYSAGKEKVGDMMDAGADIFSPDTLGKPGDDFLNMSQEEYDAYRKNKLAQLPKDSKSDSSIYDYGNIPNPMMSRRQPFPGFRDGIPSLLNTSTDTAGIERLFKLPPGSGTGFNIFDLSQIPPQSTGQTGNYLVRDPSIRTPFINNQLTGMNLNQGGLASLDNANYQRLMNASNFGF